MISEGNLGSVKEGACHLSVYTQLFSRILIRKAGYLMKSVPRLMNIQAIVEHRFQKIVLQKQFWNTASKKTVI
jgi:hypothetical protein